MKDWLTNSLFDLTEDQEDYLLSRGVLREEIENIGFQSWLAEDPSPNSDFARMYGAKGHRFSSLVVTPLYSPKGDLVGIEGRSIDGNKTILRYLTNQAKWNPVWLGLGAKEMLRIWNGYDVWIVEGIFDVTALRSVMPHVVVLGSLRANLTRKHLNFLQRFVKGTVYVAYDNDETGQKAMFGSFDEQGRRHTGVVERINKLKLHCVPVRYQGGKDPNEIWESGGYPAVAKAFSQYM